MKVPEGILYRGKEQIADSNSNKDGWVTAAGE